MWVRQTTHGFHLCRDLVALDVDMLAELTANVIYAPPPSQRGVVVEAPYAVWKHLYGLLFRYTFGPRGGRKSSTAFTAIRRITKELNYMETHPALSKAGMMGWQADLLPVWRIEPDEEGRCYTLAPTPGHEFIILTPIWEGGSMRLTRWVEQPSGPGRMCTEATHLRLQRHSVV